QGSPIVPGEAVLRAGVNSSGLPGRLWRHQVASALLSAAVHGGPWWLRFVRPGHPWPGATPRQRDSVALARPGSALEVRLLEQAFVLVRHQDRKSTRLNSSHVKR